MKAREKYRKQKRTIQRKKGEIGKRKKSRGSREADPEAAIQSEVKEQAKETHEEKEK